MEQPHKKYPHLLLWLLLAAIASTAVFRYIPGASAFYLSYIYIPLQQVRQVVLHYSPISLGDLLYTAAGLYILRKIVISLLLLTQRKLTLKATLSDTIQLLKSCAIIYLVFLWGWGANYYRQPLGEAMYLPQPHKFTVQELVDFNLFLAQKINEQCDQQRPLSFSQQRQLAASQFQATYPNVSPAVYFKPHYSLYSGMLMRLGIEGYFNPFTGEAQVSNKVPDFIMPYVLLHEMAHQCGVASEQDANFVAYILGVSHPEPSFKYAAYLSIFQYSWPRLLLKDSMAAKNIYATLHLKVTQHLDSLERLSRLYDNDAAQYSATAYDAYLKLQHQSNGLKSYGSVVYSAWLWEQERSRGNKCYPAIF